MSPAAGKQADAGLIGMELLSAATAPFWATAIIGLATLFVWAFLLKGKSLTIIRSEQKKKEMYEELMETVRLYVLANDEKSQDAESTSKRKSLDCEEEKDPMEGMPEASRLFDLLWDDVKEVRTTSYGIAPQSELVCYIEKLFRRMLSHELGKIIKVTRTAWDKFTKAEADGMKALDKEEAEHLDGEKLRAKIEFARAKVVKHLGWGFVDAEMLREADNVLAMVAHVQRKNMLSLFALIRPCLPAIGLAVFCNMIVQSLQSVYYQIGRWQLVGDAAVAQDHDRVVYHLVDLAFGHLVIWFFETIVDSYSKRASGVFGQNVRNGVMRALMQQDQEYFDKNSSGALQERLNRDAEQLGNNCVQLPQQLLGNLACIIVNLLQVYSVCPSDLFYIAVAPLPLITLGHYKLNKFTSRMDSLGRKISEQAAANTAEVLKEIKTVRQFANERHETANFARCELMRNDLEENSTVSNTLAGKLFGVIIVAGLIYTEYIGAGLVREGKMTPGLLFDITIKLNFWVIFKTNEIVNLLPQLRRSLEPLGRVCTLLESSPHIEASGRLRSVTCPAGRGLSAFLAKCETMEDAKRGRTRTVLREAVDLGDGEPPMPKGSIIKSFERCGEERTMWGKEWLMQQCGVSSSGSSAHPVTFFFSRKKMPVHFDGLIEFDDVVFRYPTDRRKLVLSGMSFRVEPRQKVALVGEAGCGKSSCMALLQRLYDPEAGCIRIDGVPMQEYNVNFLRSRVVIVDQKPVLFAATVRENVTYGLHHDVSDDEVKQVLADASMWDGDNGIKSKPDGILTRLGSGGISLSGGQTQRVSIARAMIRNPDVILLDEATSALDNKNEKIVQEALDRLARRGSALVIAHRLTTIKDADKIVVIRKGRVAEHGTHDELLQKPIEREVDAAGEEDVVSGIYRFLWELQFAKDPGEEDKTIKDALVEMKDIEKAETMEPFDACADSIRLSYEPSPGSPTDLARREHSNPVSSRQRSTGTLSPTYQLHLKKKSFMYRRLREIMGDLPVATHAKTGLCGSQADEVYDDFPKTMTM